MTAAEVLRVRGDVAAQIRRGLPVGTVARLQAVLGISPGDLSKILRLAPRTLTRRRAERRFNVEESDRIARVASVIALGVEALGTQERASQWIRTPNYALGGKRPLEYLDTQVGTEQVRSVLSGLIYGGVV